MSIPTVDAVMSDVRKKPESFFSDKGDRMALKLFHDMAQRVPAYNDFLKKKNIRAEKITSIEDFKQVPAIDKDSYLRQYPRDMLMWDGDMRKSWEISTTSGSTGVPYYFPRTYQQDLQYALMAEMYLLTNFKIDTRSTLYIVGFPMGAWIGGVFTYEALRIIAQRGKYPLSVITPGINKQEIISAVKNLGGDFDQVIIGSYAPFLKDILDDGLRLGLDWTSYQLGFIFSAEVFSEAFRDYVAYVTGLKNVCIQTLNHYGTVDLGTMSYETPLAIALRRSLVSNAVLYEHVFNGVRKLPTLTQYIPDQFYFEDIDGNLLCSAYSGIPLVRYDLKDRGGVIRFADMEKHFDKHGEPISSMLPKYDIPQSMIWNLPFVYVYERSDFSVSFFAFQIYPETIRNALLENVIQQYVTGKFTMLVTYDKKGNQQFHIHVELKEHVQASSAIRERVKKQVVKTLLVTNSEYRKTHEMYKSRVFPIIHLHEYENVEYFRPGVKQKWVRREKTSI